jgi:hypothetical protein
VILPDHLRQGDAGVPKTPEHGPVGLEHLLLLSWRDRSPSSFATSQWGSWCMPEARARGRSASRTTPCASRCSSWSVALRC